MAATRLALSMDGMFVFALSLTVIPVLWAFARFAPAYIWWSYLVAYVIEIAVIAVLEKACSQLEFRKH